MTRGLADWLVWAAVLGALFAICVPVAKAEDCNGNTVEDALDITRGTSLDCNTNGVPDECDMSGVGFASTVYYPIPRGAYAVRSADVDGDHDMDLVVIGGQSTDNFSVLRSRGDGTFTGPEDYTGPTWPNALAVADLNGDTLPEIILVSGDGTTIFNNLGDGTFGLRADYATQRTREVEAADLDGDGDLDLVLVSWNYGYEVAKVRVWKNNGAGGFTPTNYNIGNSLGGLVVSDLDGDGDKDIAVGDGKAACNCIHILLNDGSGAFAAAADRVVGGVPYRLGAADLDGDGCMDLALVKNSYAFSVLLNNGDATFADTPARSLTYLPYWLELGDLDRDGDIDLVTTSNTNIDVLLNPGTGLLGRELMFNVYTRPSGDGPTGIAMADLDADGLPDLAVANVNSDDVAVLLNRSVMPASRDWDRDGVPDECEGCVKTRDWDNDGDVDSDDVSSFMLCVAGPAVAVAEECEGGDFDCDGDVDQDDFGRFQRCFSGTGRRADPHCAE